MALTRESLLVFFERELGLSTNDIEDASLLFSEGVIDSLGVLDLVTFIATAAGIDVQPSEITLDNFDSVGRILAFAARKAS